MDDLVTWLREPSCSVEGCERGGKITRGMCQTHYSRWLARTPADQRGPAPRDARRFEDYVAKQPGGCWIWTGSTNRTGYGQWAAGGRKWLAHRYALAASVPCPDEALLACHHCDNPPCVNPEHLYWGTHKDNAADASARDRIPNKGRYKTHCAKGHEIAGANLVIVGKVRRRYCKQCWNERRARSARVIVARRAAPPPAGRTSTDQIMERYGVPHATVFSWRRAGRLGEPVIVGKVAWWRDEELAAALAAYRPKRKVS